MNVKSSKKQIISNSLSQAPQSAFQLEKFSAKDDNSMPSQPLEASTKELQLLVHRGILCSHTCMAEYLYRFTMPLSRISKALKAIFHVFVFSSMPCKALSEICLRPAILKAYS